MERAIGYRKARLEGGEREGGNPRDYTSLKTMT